MILKEGNLRRDEAELLKSSNYGFRAFNNRDIPLSYYFGRATWCTVQVEAVFVLTLATFMIPYWTPAVLCGVTALRIVGVWLARLAVVAVSAGDGKLRAHHRVALCYWAWWPACMLCFCLIAVVCAGILGYHLWVSYIQPFHRVARLQRYSDINPAIVPGGQIQDSGLVEFSSTVNIDRARGGCFVNGGDTYCVAPIIHGGHVLTSLADAPRFGSYDYFAVGINCCNCPNQDFRCGEWANPFAQGGMRSTDRMSRPFFRLAVDDWTAIYRKASKHPLFFEWVQSPVRHWLGLRAWAFHLVLLAVCAVVPCAFFAGLLLSVALRMLEAQGMLSPEVPPLPPRLARLWARVLPEALARAAPGPAEYGAAHACPAPRPPAGPGLA
mmetsp:Transcript_81222/g.230073  ORF Transcript_81222/g.230073 Transcript_81222/m.230073 type:complete len:382 (+) Transcript_81222:145-1290(+)